MTSNEELVRLIQLGYDRDNRLTQLWDQNKPLIYRFAKSYMTRHTTIEDLMQEAFIGFMQAVEDYKSDKGANFMTYAEYHIRGRLGRSMSKQEPVRIPEHARERYLKYNRFKEEWRKENGTYPEKEDVLLELNMSNNQYEKIKLVSLLLNQASLDTPLGTDEGSRTIQDTVSCKFDLENFVCDRFFADYEKVTLWSEVDKLEENKRIVIRDYYKKRLPVDLIATKLGLSIAQIHQLHDTALSELRSKGVLKRLLSLSEYENAIGRRMASRHTPSVSLEADDDLKSIHQQLVKINQRKLELQLERQ